MAKLTDRALKALTLTDGQKDRLVFDDECPGLGVRVTAKGTKSFIAQWTDPVTRRKVREPLGVWGSITLDQARTATRARLGEVAKGIDPSAERRRKREAEAAAKAEEALSLDALITQWRELHLVNRRPGYAIEAQRALRFSFASHLKRPASRLSRSIAIDVLDRLVRDGRTTAAARTMAYGRACYGWAHKRGKVSANPFAGLPVASSSVERERVLSEREVRQVWSAAGSLPYPFGPFFRLALLTLQRRDEVAGMSWREITADGLTWTIPAERMKNGRSHDVHLAPAARTLLDGIPRRAGSDLVFTTTGRSPISGFSKAKENLAALMSAGEEAGHPPSWRLHDFRRSGVSCLAAMGFDSIVVDKLLAHKATKLKGVASVYQRHDFAAERRRALEAWAAHVLGSDAANVIQLRAGR